MRSSMKSIDDEDGLTEEEEEEEDDWDRVQNLVSMYYSSSIHHRMHASNCSASNITLIHPSLLKDARTIDAIDLDKSTHMRDEDVSVSTRIARTSSINHGHFSALPFSLSRVIIRYTNTW